MYGVQQIGDALNFVNDKNAFVGMFCNYGMETLGVAGQLTPNIR